MTGRSVYPHLLDSECFDEPLLTRLYDAAGEIEKELQFLKRVFHIGNIGPWEQFDEIELYLTRSWLHVFGQKANAITLGDYLALINDPVERQRVRESRETLPYQAVGTKWRDEFTICGKRILSTAFVTGEQSVIGVDVMLAPNKFGG